VASRWAHRLPLVALSRRSTGLRQLFAGAQVGIGRRRGVTVRFSVVGVSSRRRDFANVFALLRR